VSESEDSYGQIIEESLKEFSMSLTMEQLQSELAEFEFEQENSAEHKPESQPSPEQIKSCLKMPIITKVPKFTSKQELIAYLNSDAIRTLRP